ncbi:MAG: GAF domain-containing protein [Candidatus Omnitrophica bacterium]|nr:GAF domain-containing protein [Candidatus Omnitrophota bacterium]
MLEAPVPRNETERLTALRALNILDTPAEERFDRIVRMAKHIFNVPFITLSLVDGGRVWFKSRIGTESTGGPRAVSFCGHAVVHDGLLLVPDTKKDPRFADNPFVTGKPYIRFYAGYPLSNTTGFRIGAFCIQDTVPRELTGEEKKMLEGLAAWAELEVNLFQCRQLASIGQLAAGAAQEINNPMGFISSNMDVLGRYVSDYGKVLVMANHLKESVQEENLPKAKSIAGEITKLEEEINLDYILGDVDNLLTDNQKGIERIRKIITNLRTFAREDRGDLELIKIEHIIEAILTILQGEIKHKSRFRKNYGDTPFIQCNPQQLGQVFINLFLNAMQAVEEDGVIEVTTYRRDKNVCVDIRETGKDIDKQNLDQILDPFFTAKAVGQGTGLDLSVSREIVKKYGGDIQVQTTTFTVLLPVEKKRKEVPQ